MAPIRTVIAAVVECVSDSIGPKGDRGIELPIFPLGSVLFPGGTMALKVFEQRYLEMAKVCLKSGSPFGIALIREGSEVGIPAVPESIGTLARVVEWDMQNLGILQLRVKGAQRFRLDSQSVSKSGLIIGRASMIPDDANVECPEHAACAEFLRKVFAKVDPNGNPEEAHFNDAGWVGFRVTEMLPFSSAVKQKMLELTDARARLEILHSFLVDHRLSG